MMERYTKYKDSGIAWLGEIPEHWNITSWRRIISVLTDYTANGSFADLKKNVEYRNEPDFARLVRLTDLRKGIKDSNEGVWISEDAYNYLKKSALFGGEFLIANVGAYSGIVFLMPYINQPASLAPNMMIAKFNQNKIDNQYIFYAANSVYIQEPLRITALSSAQPKLNKDHVKAVIFIIPPLKEQKAIAAYLDTKTAEIDQLIAQKERLIKLYEEEKTAIINEAVTKGINPNVKLKSSGIDWLGDIPEHWNLKRLRYLGTCQNGVSKSAEYFGSGYPFVNYTDVYNNIELPQEVQGLANSTDEDQISYSVKQGDIFFTRTSETIEEIGIASTCLKTIENAIFSGFLIRFRPFDKLLFIGFSKYYFRSRVRELFFVKEMNLVTRASLSQELLKKLPVLLPPIEEQKEIVNYIEKECARIDSKIAKTKRIIELQKEYRTALISEAVTGKIKVPELVS